MNRRVWFGWCAALLVSGAASAAPAQPAANAGGGGGGGGGATHGGGGGGGGGFAHQYAQGSVGLTQFGGLMATPGGSALVFGYGQPIGVLGLGAAVRITTHHFLIEPQLGFGAGGFVSGGLWGTSAVMITGVGLGAALAITDRLALSPMGRITFDVAFGGGFNTLLMGELPFTIFVGRNGYIEPYVTLGTAIVTDTRPVSTVLFALGAGYRLGIVF